MASKPNVEWSKAYKCVPQDNIISHRYAKSKPFIPSYEKMNCPVSMNLLLGWEYARIWENEHENYLQNRKQSEKTKIVRRTPYKVKPKKVATKAERFKMKKFQNVGNRMGGKGAKLQKTSGGFGGGGGGGGGCTGGRGAAGAEPFNNAYGDILPAGLNTESPGPIQPNFVIENASCPEGANTLQDVKYMKQNMQYPKTYIDPNAYLAGIPMDAGGNSCPA